MKKTPKSDPISPKHCNGACHCEVRSSPDTNPNPNRVRKRREICYERVLCSNTYIEISRLTRKLNDDVIISLRPWISMVIRAEAHWSQECVNDVAISIRYGKYGQFDVIKVIV